jgi:hypothetical protein
VSGVSLQLATVRFRTKTKVLNHDEPPAVALHTEIIPYSHYFSVKLAIVGLLSPLLIHYPQAGVAFHFDW